MKNIKNIILLSWVVNISVFAQVDFSNIEIATSTSYVKSLSKVQKKSNLEKSVTSSPILGDYVWYDHNQNGLQDLGELGVYGIEIKLFDNPNCVGSEIASTQSSDVGYYEFTNITPNGSNYCMEVVYPAYWTKTVNSTIIDTNNHMGKIPNIVLEDNKSYDIGLQHEDNNCQVPTLNPTEIGVFDNRKSWAKRASLDVEFKNITISAYCHEFNNRGPERGDHYTVHNDDRKGFSELQRDRLSRIFRFMSDSDIVRMVEDTFSDKNLEIFFNISNNALIWYYSDWNNEFSRVENYIDNSSWSNKLSIEEKSSLKKITQVIINKIEGVNGEVQYEPMKVYYLWNEDNRTHQDLIAPETLVIPKKEECVAPLHSASLGNFVWYDADRNGKQDKGEVGLGNVMVNLYNSLDILVGTVKTDNNGAYLFNNLAADEYVAEFVALEEYSITVKDIEGVSNELNSDANPNSGKTNPILLLEGSKNLMIDVGMYLTPQPSIKIIKTTNGGDVGNIMVGDTISWSYLVSNTGNTLLSNISIIDDKEGEVIECLGEGSLDLLTPKKSMTCTKTGVAVLGAYTNNVTVTAKDTNNHLVTSKDSSSYVGRDVPVILGSIGDFVWLDTNRNGIQDGDELGLSGINIQLLDKDGKVIQSTKTGNLGEYEFKKLPEGEYFVKFMIPNSYIVTKKSEGSEREKDSDTNENGKTAQITLIAGENKKDIDVGLSSKLANLGDKVWFDRNANGIQDVNETQGVENVLVKLYDENNKFIAETKTVSTGQYLFRNLVPGNYYVIFEMPSNYKVSPQLIANNTSKDSNANPSSGKTKIFRLFAGRDDKSIDMGLYQETTKVGDRVFYDLNKNGIQDNGENGVANVVVKLYSADNGTLIKTTKTSASGIYLFEDITPSEYYIVFIKPAGYTITDAGKGTQEKDSNPDKSGRTENFTLNAGTQNSSIDMGVYQNVVSFGDKVFLDTNHNGLQDIGEKGVRDVKVTIVSANSDFKKSMLTDENGNYLFTHLSAGEYSAEFSDIPYGHLITQKDVNENNNDLNDSDGFLKDKKIITEVALLTPGMNDLSWDLGIYKTVCLPGKSVLGNLVWEDFNKNGIQDIGERGIENIAVTLYNNDTDEKIATTITDGNGLYEFAHVNPEFNYYVQFTVPAGYVVSPQNQDEETIDSNADATGKTDVITLIADKINSSVDMGLYHEGATIGDRVFFDDFNGVSNGIQDLGEQGVFDVKVTLYDVNGKEIQTTRTNASGEYHFTNVEIGRYTIGFSELPESYVFAGKNQGNDEERDSDVNSNGRTSVIIINGTSIITSIDAGLKKLATGIASNDIKRGVSGQNVTLDVLLNDTDGTFNFDATTVRITSIPEGAALSVDGKRLIVPNEGIWSVHPETGEITFTPKDGFVGDPTSISYTVQDTQGNETSADVEINYPPHAKDDNVNGEAGQQIVVFVLENDRATSTPLDKASVRLIDSSNEEEVETVTIEGEGVWSTNVDGSITFTPEDGFVNNPTAIQYVVRELAGDTSNRATITIIYPDAVDDIVTLPSAHTGSTTVNVSENDSNNTVVDSITIGCNEVGVKRLIVKNEGTWEVGENGTITFTPLEGFIADATDIKYTTALVIGGRSNCANIDLRHELLAHNDIVTLNVGGVSVINVLTNDLGALNPRTVELVMPENPIVGTILSDDAKTLTVPGEGIWSVNNEGIVTFRAEDGFVTAPTSIFYSVENVDGTRSNIEQIILTDGAVTITANDDTATANGAEPVRINVLLNDEGDINGTSIRFINLNREEVTRLEVEDEGIWSVNINGIVTFTGNIGYIGTPTPIEYVVRSNLLGVKDSAIIRIKGTCNCTPYETSIPAMGKIAAILIILLTILFTNILLSNEKFISVK